MSAIINTLEAGLGCMVSSQTSAINVALELTVEGIIMIEDFSIGTALMDGKAINASGYEVTQLTTFSKIDSGYFLVGVVNNMIMMFNEKGMVSDVASPFDLRNISSENTSD